MENLLTPFFQNPVAQISALACLRILGYRDLLKEYELQINIAHFHLIQSAFEEAKILIQTYYGPEYLQKCGYDFAQSLKKIQVGGRVFIHLPSRFDEKGQSFATLLLSHFLRCFQFLLLLKGYYVRGVLDFGNLAAQPDAFITSHLDFLLEQEKIARYPRITLSPRALTHMTRGQNWQVAGAPSMVILAQEEEKIFFINPLYYQDFWEQGQNKLNQHLNALYVRPGEASLPFADLWNSGIQATQKFLEMTRGFTESYLEANQKNINAYLRTIVGNQLLKFSFSPPIREKYEWLFNFITWCNQKDIKNSAMFSYFAPVS